MAANSQAHAEILSVDLDRLRTSPQAVSQDDIEQMRQHLQVYREEFGQADRKKELLIFPLVAFTMLALFVTFGFFGAAPLWALQGTCPWSVTLVSSVLFPLNIWVYRKLEAWYDKVRAANSYAFWLTEQLVPSPGHEWDRANIIRTLCPEAEAYFTKVTAAGAPARFQLQALHRVANVLSEVDESAMEDGGPCDAPRTALYLHQHPNWKPAPKQG